MCPNSVCEPHHQLTPHLPTSENGSGICLACPACRQLCTGLGLPQGFRKVTGTWVLIHLVCQGGGRKHLTEFFALVPGAEDKQMWGDLWKKLDMEHWTGILLCGHSIRSVEREFWFERVSATAAAAVVEHRYHRARLTRTKTLSSLTL